jgi:hypothetical protein
MWVSALDHLTVTGARFTLVIVIVELLYEYVQLAFFKKKRESEARRGEDLSYRVNWNKVHSSVKDYCDRVVKDKQLDDAHTSQRIQEQTAIWSAKHNPFKAGHETSDLDQPRKWNERFTNIFLIHKRHKH